MCVPWNWSDIRQKIRLGILAVATVLIVFAVLLLAVVS